MSFQDHLTVDMFNLFCSENITDFEKKLYVRFCLEVQQVSLSFFACTTLCICEQAKFEGSVLEKVHLLAMPQFHCHNLAYKFWPLHFSAFRWCYYSQFPGIFDSEKGTREIAWSSFGIRRRESTKKKKKPNQSHRGRQILKRRVPGKIQSSVMICMVERAKEKDWEETSKLSSFFVAMCIGWLFDDEVR